MTRAETKEPIQFTRRGERGQTTIFVVLTLGIFLLGFIGFGVDMTNLWFHRQMAQGAADASCQACAMNMLMDADGVPTPGQGFTIGTDFDCGGGSNPLPNAAPCKYAALNGYNGAGLVAGAASNSVSFDFSPTVPAGVTVPPGNLAPVAFVQVDVMDRVQVLFSSLLTGAGAMDVHAYAVCGLQMAKAPIPIIVLNPTCQHPFEVSGSATIRVVGGPRKSVQVNSINQDCAAATQSSAAGCSSSGTIDLSQGGPDFTGSNFGVLGAPGVAPVNYAGGATGRWVSPAARIGDPFARVPPPAVPPLAPPVEAVAYGVDGCPDQTAGCIRYFPGLYDKPIVVKGYTAIFNPGLYYLQPTSYTIPAWYNVDPLNPENGLANCGSPGSGCVPKPTGQCSYDFIVDSNGVVRPSSVPGNGEGTIFYLSGPNSGSRPYGSVFFGANAGTSGPRIVDPYVTALATCPGGDPPALQLNVPATVPGNVLAGQCTGGGSYLGAPSLEIAGGIRGLLFFQDRNNGTNQTYLNGQPSMQGGGGLVLSGSLYFHNCTALPCLDPIANYNAFFELRGNPGGGTYVLGNITTDQLIIGGNGEVAMQLNPNAVYTILKAGMVR